jgi:hypothetical protein
MVSKVLFIICKGFNILNPSRFSCAVKKLENTEVTTSAGMAPGVHSGGFSKGSIARNPVRSRDCTELDKNLAKLRYKRLEVPT